MPAASLGIATFVPFLHAASRLPYRSTSWVLAAVYTASSIGALAIVVTAPEGPAGENSLQANIGVVLGWAVAASAYLFLPRLRREVYGLPDMSPRPPRGGSPAVEVALAERAQRRKAAQLVASDPNLARELRIGRPDLPRSYDDGGLVDLNAFDADGLAGYIGLPPDVAQRIVDARELMDGFTSINEVCALVGISQATEEVLKDRCVVVPRLS